MDITRLNFLATKLVVAFLYGSDFLSADFGDFSLLASAAGLARVRAGASLAVAGELVFMTKVAGGGSQLMTAPGTVCGL